MMPKLLSFIPKLRRRGSHKIVTIGAGVVAADGIVLAADSQETLDDYLKLFKPKVVQLPLGSSEIKCIVVGSGDGPFIDQIIEKIGALLSIIDPYLENARDTVQQAIHDVCHQVFPFYSQESKPQAHLLIGIRATDGLALLDAMVPMLKNAEQCTFIGFGRDLAAYKAKQLMIPQMPVSVVAPLTAYILDIAKKNVERCGGDTKMVVMRGDGEVEEKPASFISNAEKGYENASWFIETVLFPLLPAAISRDGKDVLTVIADLGKTADKRKEIAEGIAKFLNPRKVSTPSDEASSAAVILMFALGIIKDGALPQLVRAGVISSEVYKKLEIYLNVPRLLSQAGFQLIKDGKVEAGQKQLELATRFFGVLASNPSLTLKTLEGQQ